MKFKLPVFEAEITPFDMDLSYTESWEVDDLTTIDVKFSTGAVYDCKYTNLGFTSQHKISVGIKF